MKQKVKKLFLKGFNWFNSISNNKWCIFCLIINLFIIVLLNYKIITTPFIHAEDGKIFIRQFLEFGWGSLFTSFGGHLYVLTRIIIGISVTIGKLFNSTVVLGHMENYLCIFLSGVIVTYLCSDCFSAFIKSRYMRLLLSILLIINLDGFMFLFYNAVSFHWWTGVLSILVAIQLINNKMPSYKMMPLILLSIISSASSMILGFAVLYYFIKNIDFKHIIKSLFKDMNRNNLIKLCLLIIFLSIQSYAILFISGVTETSTVAGKTSYFLLFVNSVKLFLSSPCLLFGHQFNLALYRIGVDINIVVGSIIWLIIAYNASIHKKTKYFCASTLAIIVMYMIVLYKRLTFNDGYSILYECDGAIWYNCIQSTIILLLVFNILYEKLIQNKVLIPFFCFFIILLGGLYYDNIIHTDFSKSPLLYEIDEYVDYSSDKYVEVDISGGMTMPVPVRGDYFENQD